MRKIFGKVRTRLLSRTTPRLADPAPDLGLSVSGLWNERDHENEVTLRIVHARIQERALTSEDDTVFNCCSS